MGGGHAPTDPPEKEEEERPSLLPSMDGLRLAEAPILLLVYFHFAIRAELAELRRVAVAAAADEKSESHSRELVVELSGRFQFLKLVYKYHCAAEDEVVFLALDAHVKNVACTYSLEHESIDTLFGSVFCCLNALEESKNISKALQELVFCIGTIQSSICKHMLKEEKQVFPQLVNQFSSQQQASLVWQFIGSIPIILLQDFLPWMISFFHPQEQEEIKNFIKEVVPKEKSLQEVVLSSLGKKHQTIFGFHTELAKGVGPLDGTTSIKGKFEFNFIKRPLGWKEVHCFQTNDGNNPVDSLLLWHGAIQKDLKEILSELHQLKISRCFQNLDFIVLRLKFLADVLIFYSNALEKFFYPVLVDISNIQLSLPTQHLYIASHIEQLQYLLHYNDQKGIQTNKFVEKLCQKLGSFVMNVDKQFSLQEKEVFPVISKNCSEEMQQQLLCMSLHVLPLGLLKCVVTWFAAHLSEDESRSILQILNQGSSLINKSFASLLLDWFHIGYSGKTSVESFRRDLEKMFSSRCSSLSMPIEEDAESSSLPSDMLLCKGSKSKLIKPLFVNKGKKGFSFSSASSHGTNHFDTSYCSGINLQIFFPKTIRDLYSFSNFPGEKSCADSDINEPIPMDLIFFFHRALKKDLDYLVLGSAQLAENVGFLTEFRQRFHLIQFLYQIHSDAEDEVAFPALEARGKLRNISHSYALDHKMEVENFSKISLILDEIYELDIISSSGESIMLDREAKHQQLCINLQDTCKSMHKLLSDHVHREEVELWPLFRECFSLEEQEKIIGNMLGRTGAEILKDMMPWLMASLTPDEQQVVMSLWHKATRNTMFDEWLGEWWEGHKIAKAAEESTTPWIADPLVIISTYLPKALDEQEAICDNFLRASSIGADIELLGMPNMDDKVKVFKGDDNCSECSECSGLFSSSNDKLCNEAADLMTNEPGQKVTQNSGQCKHLLTMSQEDLEAAIRKVSSDTSLDPEKKSHVMQNLLMSRWILKQQIYNLEVNKSKNGEETPGQYPSYRDPLKLALGCKHYKRNCKLFAACCNQLYTCIRCHDEVADHSLERKSVTKMMCMKCLIIQPIGSTCSTVSCNNLTMGKYYCRICKLFDDEREIYHCPYCNLCRVGKGLGIDYFHCMNCNACMSRSLSLHVCREKSFEDNCPICHEDIFTSTAPVKALPCGHMMHSICFKEYTCTHYTCPICSKSLGDMQVYFKMLDALLVEEKIPDEYHGRTQVILCNDCEKRGTAPFHWLYHKCSNCGSYNTRLL
ncbi:zinc finger protein BRUTUS-like At1g74770 [Durio zibethinus]|uniref:Zinc finger protein BRUTUS-like At1g74770 n=1 Tax=Durio zibethinus TaxID=66656 RepID=A0A6P6ATF5_DURZI|nr:zinc finger protein BRUTUS-like At1g74770 [Durio zibethinus]